MNSFATIKTQVKPNHFSFTFNFTGSDQEKNLKTLYTALTACPDFLGAELSIIKDSASNCKSLDDTCALIYSKRTAIGSWENLRDTYYNVDNGAILTGALEFDFDDYLEMVHFSVVIPPSYYGEGKDQMIITAYASDFEDASDVADIVIDELETALTCAEDDFYSWDDDPTMTDEPLHPLFDDLPY